jgi:hypothetical protein
MMANYVLFVFVTSGEFVDQIWMSIYSGEEVQGETDDNKPCSALFRVRVRVPACNSVTPTENRSV